MKNLRLVCIFFFVSGITLAQSKKEMIVILNNRVDSLNQIVATERSDKLKLNTEISNLKSQIKELENTKENLSNDKNALETKNNALNKQLKIKQDSLVLVTTELLKYRPAPKQELVVKQDNTGPFETVTIGTQVWMLRNLDVSTFKNGIAIPQLQDKYDWDNAGDNKQPAWCYYNGIGKLYNWYAVIDNNGLCPQGWHVPSDAEWDTLIEYLGGQNVAGSKMKAKPIIEKQVDYYDTGGYYDTKSCSNCYTASAEYKKICPVCKGTGVVKTNKFIPKGKRKYVSEIKTGGWNGSNESGFTGLPGGYRDREGFRFQGEHAYWWSSTLQEYNYLYLFDDKSYAGRGFFLSFYFDYGLSVRCLKD